MAQSNILPSRKFTEKELCVIKDFLWGKDIKHDVFRRWTQGFTFSDDEPTALIQLQGGPCAVIVPIQAFLLKELLFSEEFGSPDWRKITGANLDAAMRLALIEIFLQLDTTHSLYYFITTETNIDKDIPASTSTIQENGTDESSPKRPCYSDDQFHESLVCCTCSNREELQQAIDDNFSLFQQEHGVLLFLYSIILSKGLEQIKNEMEDPSEPLIDPIHGHGSQSMINLLLTGKASSHVFDDEKDICGLKLHGIKERSTIGFLTFLEHLRYLEVGWYLKNPKYPVWLLGSETHLSIIFSQDANLVSGEESDEAKARRVFSSFDSDGSGFVAATQLGELMDELNLESEPDYVKIMQEKLDPEELGIVTLSSFMGEFYPSDAASDTICSHEVLHYNGLSRSHDDNKVQYAEGTALIKDSPEVQFISDSSPIKYCMMTKWPTLELSWKTDRIPSLN